ncbi:endonuclease [Saccharopolyspora sp. HNM0986]|uniref:endonuclease n=1 Tax=Saccharopolyspora galaxeae TaxID=2781241 RepID=UPI0019097C7A|nr:endonuclease [Saccharopolyspora sp. HNM0986]MBK0865431.1 endonuclease [Saccharopolyspora sp. HNM0986]
MSEQATARAIIREAGTSYAAQAGFTLTDKPSQLYRLLVLSVLLSTRIKAEIAVSAARELGAFPTARRMREATWQQRVDALGRGSYVRYDESTATALGNGADLLLDKYGGDLRKLRKEAGGDVRRIKELLREVPNLGPVGIDIFCREAQAVWPELRPYFDKKALSGAEKAGLPKDAGRLAELVDAADYARFSAALVRLTLEKGLLEEIKAPA